MSRAAQIILIVSPQDQPGAQDLAFWMAGPNALDRSQFPERSRGDSAGEHLPPLPSVGPLLPINGPVGLEAWGGHKNPSTTIWGAVTNHLNWTAFLDQVAATAWNDPGAVQLLIADEADSCFRLYMLNNGTLTNLVPEPADGDYEHPW